VNSFFIRWTYGKFQVWELQGFWLVDAYGQILSQTLELIAYPVV